MSTPSDASSPRRSPLLAFAGALVSTALDFGLLALALGGATPVLSHPQALGLLAVWLVGAVILALVRPVRARSGTRRDTDPLLLLALFLLPLLTPACAAWGERIGLWPIPGGWPGVILTAGGLALRIAAMMQLGSRFDPSVAILPGHALETRGLYARIRHPGYAGALLAALGAVIAFRSAFGLIPVVLMAVALTLRVRNEERALEAHFGEAFREYRAKSGAFLPRFAR